MRLMQNGGRKNTAQGSRRMVPDLSKAFCCHTGNKNSNKLINRVTPCRSFLRCIRISDSDACPFCQEPSGHLVTFLPWLLQHACILGSYPTKDKPNRGPVDGQHLQKGSPVWCTLQFPQEQSDQGDPPAGWILYPQAEVVLQRRT